MCLAQRLKIAKYCPTYLKQYKYFSQRVTLSLTECHPPSCGINEIPQEALPVLPPKYVPYNSVYIFSSSSSDSDKAQTPSISTGLNLS